LRDNESGTPRKANLSESQGRKILGLKLLKSNHGRQKAEMANPMKVGGAKPVGLPLSQDNQDSQATEKGLPERKSGTQSQGLKPQDYYNLIVAMTAR
jgi:hypothetical protein